MYIFDFSLDGFNLYIIEFCGKYGFPKEAEQSFCDVLRALSASEEYGEFTNQIKSYYTDYNIDFDSISKRQSQIAEKLNISFYTLQMVYFILLTPHLKTLYKQNFYPDNMYDSSVLDLKWKLFECHKRYGVWGLFVGFWTIGFFKLERFGMGRLQFNLLPFNREYNENGFIIKKGELTIDTHIPSSGPLRKEEYMQSYALAAEFFKKHFKREYAVFSCYSWLLSPNNKLILPENSNILKFAEDYNLIYSASDPGNKDLWRIFDKSSETEDFSDLPCETSLQKGYLDWLKNGNSMGIGYGVFFYKYGNILK